MAQTAGVYAQAAGRVSRVFSMKNGPALVLEVQLSDRDKYPSRVTVWGADALPAAEGDDLVVKGWLSWRPSEYQKRDGSTGHGVEVSLNAPVLVSHTPAAQLPGAEDPNAPF